MNERRDALRLPVKLFVDHILSEEQHCLCVTEDLGFEGLRLSGTPGRGWGSPRHVWLQFRLPDGDGDLIRALGQVCYEGAGDGGERIRGFRFKYLNPRSRRRYDAFLQSALEVGAGAA